MRINIYSEELGEGCEVVRKTSAQGEVFIGLRVWLETPGSLLARSTADNDHSAVTFWMRSLEDAQALIDELQGAVDRSPA